MTAVAQALRSVNAAILNIGPVRRFFRLLHEWLPKGLYYRSLFIIVAPMIILQSVVAFVFMERHWELVTTRLSAAVTSDIAAVIDLHAIYNRPEDYENLRIIARDRFGLQVAMLPQETLPPPAPKPFFSLLHRTLSLEITEKIGRPFWIDTVGRSSIVEIRILLDDGVMRVFTQRKRTYASNSHIFMVWMVGTSVVLLVFAILFLRNQILPIQRLADAAENFGKGLPAPITFKPRGAREVRRAAHAFIEMRSRIEKQIEQRTTMLTGVSHDLRTILTRFKLQLAFMPQSDDVKALHDDADQMQKMLEEYMDFARGDAGEASIKTDMTALLGSIQSEIEREGKEIDLTVRDAAIVSVKPQSLKRCVTNLVQNGLRYGSTVAVEAHLRDGIFVVTVDDDGPGIPVAEREIVFKPFYRSDDARNQDQAGSGGGTGLGLAIARDAARSHGGDIVLSNSPKGGLRAEVRIPA